MCEYYLFMVFGKRGGTESATTPPSIIYKPATARCCEITGYLRSDRLLTPSEQGATESTTPTVRRSSHVDVAAKTPRTTLRSTTPLKRT